MKILNVTQGSPEWLAVRQKHLCASDAAAMMGASKYMRRDELVRLKATGFVREIDARTQHLFDKGHAAEAAIRPYIETLIGEELFPATATDDAGRLLASYDGITMSEDAGFEHKLWNEELAAAIRAGATEFPSGQEWQLEQGLLIGKLKRIVFACSDGTPDKLVWMEYRPVPGRAEKLDAGWKQFEEDVKNYKPVEVIPAPAAKVIKQLPAIVVQVEGGVKSSNLALYKSDAMAFIRSINTDLKTDQDFVNAEADIKFCKEAESKIEAAKGQMLGQTASIDEAFRTMDEVRDALKSKRLELDKTVQAKKDSIREDIAKEGVIAYTNHVNTLNQRIGHPYMPLVQPDFYGAMKGRKTIASLRDAVNTLLAQSKIAANELADRIQINVKQLDRNKDFAFLFADAAQIVMKETDDLALLISSRIVDHKARAERERHIANAAPAPAPIAAPTAAAGPTYQEGYDALQVFVVRFGRMKEFARVVGAIEVLKQPTQRKAA